MMYLYLLESLDGKNRYLGVTPDFNLRLENHNKGKSKATKYKGPWKKLKMWEIDNVVQAKRVENKIKRMKRKLTIEYIDHFIKKTNE